VRYFIGFWKADQRFHPVRKSSCVIFSFFGENLSSLSWIKRNKTVSSEVLQRLSSESTAEKVRSCGLAERGAFKTSWKLSQDCSRISKTSKKIQGITLILERIMKGTTFDWCSLINKPQVYRGWGMLDQGSLVLEAYGVHIKILSDKQANQLITIRIQVKIRDNQLFLHL